MASKLKKIPAFTLAELLVVLVITSLVVLLSFKALALVQHQITTITTTLEKQHTIQELSRALWHDFNHAAYIKATNKQQFMVYSYKDTLHYSFKNNTVFTPNDTIGIKAESIQFYAKGTPVEEGYIDAIQINFTDTYANEPVFVYTQKSTKTEVISLWD